MKHFEYKGYYGTIEFSTEDRCLYGKLDFIRELLVMYEGQTIDELEQAFRNEVEAYLETCEKEGTKPKKPFKGVFNVRTSPELHREVALIAEEKGMTINAFFNEALKNAVEKSA